MATTNKRVKRDPFFTTEDPDCSIAAAGVEMRRHQTSMFAEFADPDDTVAGSRDHDLDVARLSSRAGLRKHEAEKGIFGYQVLRRLPGLRAMQLAHYRLDIDRLDAIAAAIAALGVDVPEEVYGLFDDVLVDIFTPTRTRQELPARNTITRRLNKIIADIDVSTAYNAAKRRRRKKGPPTPGGEVDYGPGAAGSDTAWMTLTADNASIAATRAAVDAAARQYGITCAQAVFKLLTGAITPAATPTIYAYVPAHPDGTLDESAAAFIPGFGHTGATSTAMLHHLAATYGSTVIDMDAAARKTVAGHDAPADVAAFVRGRDGGCIYPGCTRPAQACQLDHRIPFDDGGPTTASNLFCLCQHHHNLKTDKRGYYLPDPLTGEIVWLFDDGTFQLVCPDSIIGAETTPAAPRWRRSNDDAERLAKKSANFHAKSHAVLDAYENTAQAYDPHIADERDAAWAAYHQCVADLEALEAEYGLTFRYHPIPPKTVPDNELDVPDNQYFNTYDGTGSEEHFDPDDPHCYDDEDFDIHAYFRPAGYPFSTPAEDDELFTENITDELKEELANMPVILHEKDDHHEKELI